MEMDWASATWAGQMEQSNHKLVMGKLNMNDVALMMGR